MANGSALAGSKGKGLVEKVVGFLGSKEVYDDCVARVEKIKERNPPAARSLNVLGYKDGVIVGSNVFANVYFASKVLALPSEVERALESNRDYFLGNYSDIGLILREDGDSFIEENDYLAKDLAKQVRKRGFSSFPVMISLRGLKLRESQQGFYGLSFVLGDETEIVPASEFTQFNDKKRFDITDEFGLPIFKADGKRVFLTRNTGLSSLIIGKELEIKSTNFDGLDDRGNCGLARSLDHGRIIVAVGKNYDKKPEVKGEVKTAEKPVEINKDVVKDGNKDEKPVEINNAGLDILDELDEDEGKTGPPKEQRVRVSAIVSVVEKPSFKTSAKIDASKYAIIADGTKDVAAISMYPQFVGGNFDFYQMIETSKYTKEILATPRRFIRTLEAVENAMDGKELIYDVNDTLLGEFRLAEFRERLLLNGGKVIFLNGGFIKGKGFNHLDFVTFDESGQKKNPLEKCLDKEGYALLDSMNSQGIPTERDSVQKYKAGVNMYFVPTGRIVNLSELSVVTLYSNEGNEDGDITFCCTTLPTYRLLDIGGFVCVENLKK